MKTSIKAIYGIAAAVVLGALGCVKLSEGPVRTEPGVVMQVGYTPSETSTGSGVGLTTGGHLAFVSTTNTTRAHHIVVFRCQHGNFPVDDVATWKRLAVGDRVTITYCEVLEDGVSVGRYKFIRADKEKS